MLDPVVITLTESDEETNTADELEDDVSSNTCVHLHVFIRDEII